MSDTGKTLDIVLIAEHAYRVAMLQQLMRHTGLSGTIRRLGQTRRASDYLQNRAPYEKTPLPDLVLFDLAEIQEHTKSLLANLAFGALRTPVPVVLLTSPVTEELLEKGDIDCGDATMFSPRGLPDFLRKLADCRCDEFLAALVTLYQYGPILARQPARFLQGCDSEVPLSA